MENSGDPWSFTNGQALNYFECLYFLVVSDIIVFKVDFIFGGVSWTIILKYCCQNSNINKFFNKHSFTCSVEKGLPLTLDIFQETFQSILKPSTVI